MTEVEEPSSTVQEVQEQPQVEPEEVLFTPEAEIFVDPDAPVVAEFEDDIFEETGLEFEQTQETTANYPDELNDEANGDNN